MQTFKNLLERVNIIIVFFAALLLLTFTSFFIFEISAKRYSNTEEIPSIELHGWQLYEVNKEAVNIDIKGSTAKKYEDKEIYKDFEISKFNTDSIENLKGKEAISTEGMYYFPQGVEYSKTPNIHFFSQAGSYNIADEIFVGSGDFRIADTLNVTVGKDILYDKKNDTIIAKDIRSQISRFNTKDK
ncbi:hypothetical protein [Helicobacter sp. MIT 14-3879]|uniref:hypothetical protein n=1 Tax=Helicobacter sp. MIT 14-3879 TaxID=2040649 RepID=UPI000E1F97C3|nr:hypothetical protein [Helicobacter sp. MIT 14-3879]RDU60900.1 hypothetical protein CQA44_10010 [Helicobacter sp. MIT 14-3879]